MNEPTVPKQLERPALTWQVAALLLAQRIVNSSVRESDEITFEMVRRIRARQAAERDV